MELVDPLASSLRHSTAALGVELIAVVGYSADSACVVTVLAGDPASVICTPLSVLRPVLATGAESIVLLHTHRTPAPPSAADHAVTRRLRAACVLLGVTFAGHFVVHPLGVVVCDGSDRRQIA